MSWVFRARVKRIFWKSSTFKKGRLWSAKNSHDWKLGRVESLSENSLKNFWFVDFGFCVEKIRSWLESAKIESLIFFFKIWNFRAERFSKKLYLIFFSEYVYIFGVLLLPSIFFLPAFIWAILQNLSIFMSQTWFNWEMIKYDIIILIMCWNVLSFNPSFIFETCNIILSPQNVQ